jgi:hypothetical protein
MRRYLLLMILGISSLCGRTVFTPNRNYLRFRKHHVNDAREVFQDNQQDMHLIPFMNNQQSEMASVMQKLKAVMSDSQRAYAELEIITKEHKRLAEKERECTSKQGNLKKIAANLEQQLAEIIVLKNDEVTQNAGITKA